MDSVAIIDLRRLLLNSDLYIERLLRDYPELSDRITYERDKRGPLREYIYNRLWNMVNETAKYKFIELEEDLFIGQIFKDWNPHSWYRDDNKELVITDNKSFTFLTRWVEEIDGDLNAIVIKNKLHVGWKILQLDISETTLSIELYGDWRAQKWCEENQTDYTPQ